MYLQHVNVSWAMKNSFVLTFLMMHISDTQMGFLIVYLALEVGKSIQPINQNQQIWKNTFVFFIEQDKYR